MHSILCRTLERPRRTLAYRASLFMSHVCLIANSAWSYAWDISCSAKRPIGEPYECRIDQRHLPKLLKCIPTVTPNTYDSHLRRSSPEIRAVYFPVVVHDLPVACAQIRSIRAVAFFRHHASGIICTHFIWTRRVYHRLRVMVVDHTQYGEHM